MKIDSVDDELTRLEEIQSGMQNEVSRLETLVSGLSRAVLQFRFLKSAPIGAVAEESPPALVLHDSFEDATHAECPECGAGLTALEKVCWQCGESAPSAIAGEVSNGTV